MKLTVIIRDDSTFRHLQEPPNHRSVSIEFTHDQIEALRLKHGDEEIGQCFIEDRLIKKS